MGQNDKNVYVGRGQFYVSLPENKYRKFFRSIPLIGKLINPPKFEQIPTLQGIEINMDKD